MVGRVNTGGGGITTAPWAYIAVTYPSGSTCTATNGTKTLTADGTDGQYVFQIPQPSTTPENWTLTATDGTYTKTATVAIESKYQISSETLSYIRLPTGYQEVEYVQNTSRDYILLLGSTTATEAAIKKTQEVDIEFMVPSRTYYNSSNSSYNSACIFELGYVQDYVIWYSSSKLYRIYNGSALASTSGRIEIANVVKDTKYNLVFNNQNNQCLLDNALFDTLTPNAITDSNWANYMKMFSIFSHNTSEYAQIEARVYSIIIKNHSDGSIAHEFVPCYKTSAPNSGYAGFYDLATDTFVGNSHMGKGPVV